MTFMARRRCAVNPRPLRGRGWGSSDSARGMGWSVACSEPIRVEALHLAIGSPAHLIA